MVATTAGRAKYQEVAADLRAKIADSTYEVGHELPSTSQLMEIHDVSSTVVKHAIKELKNEDLVIGQPGKGVYVLRKPDTPSPSPEYVNLMNEISTLRETWTTTVRSLEERITGIEETLARMRD
jgi:DNA-binding GntR family transcriptional regulator